MKQHILIAEDEENIRLPLVLLLEREGYRVSEADNGQKAFDMILENEAGPHPIDLVVTDIYMPDMNGIDFIKLLHENGKEDIPIVAMTGYGNKEIIIQLLRYGCKDYLEKPVEFIKMLKCVENTLRFNENRKKHQQLFSPEANDKFIIEQQLDAYRLSFENLQDQIKSATRVYQQIVRIDTESYPIEMAWKNRPLAGLGGDFIDIWHSDNIYNVLIADVAGHDLGSSFHTIMIKAFFEENCRKGNDGETLFRLLNRYLLESKKNERLITGIFIHMDLNAMHADIISAAHPPMLFFRKDKLHAEKILAEGDVIGIHETPQFGSRTLILEPGDRIIIYTDGITAATYLDSATGKRKKLSVKGLEDIVLLHNEKPLQEMLDSVWDEIFIYCDARPKDDMMLFAIETPLN